MSKASFGGIPPNPEGEQPQRVIIEVGAGHYRESDWRWGSIAEHRHFGDNEHYLGLDLGAPTESYPGPSSEIDWQDQQMRRGWTDLMRGRNNHIEFCQADGMALPIRDNVADEVLYVNVFSQSDWNIQHATRMWPQLLSEANRVLKPTGRIVIHDDLTPILLTGEMPQAAKKAGLEPEDDKMEFVPNSDSDRYNALIQQYSLRNRQRVAAIWLIQKLSPEV